MQVSSATSDVSSDLKPLQATAAQALEKQRSSKSVLSKDSVAISPEAQAKAAQAIND